MVNFLCPGQHQFCSSLNKVKVEIGSIWVRNGAGIVFQDAEEYTYKTAWLVFPRFYNAIVFLYTEASGIGSCAVLIQQAYVDKSRPIAYASKALKDTEMYSE